MRGARTPADSVQTLRSPRRRGLDRQSTDVALVGTTRLRVTFFMNKFRKLGFIDDNGALKINDSLLSEVLRD